MLFTSFSSSHVSLIYNDPPKRATHNFSRWSTTTTACDSLVDRHKTRRDKTRISLHSYIYIYTLFAGLAGETTKYLCVSYMKMLKARVQPTRKYIAQSRCRWVGGASETKKAFRRLARAAIDGYAFVVFI